MPKFTAWALLWLLRLAARAQPDAETFEEVDFAIEWAQGEVGLVVVRIRPDWAPLGAARVLELVDAHFYDGCRFFRVIKNFMAQVGINGARACSARGRARALPDDPARKNTRGRVSFAMAGKGTRSTQLFFNWRQLRLDREGFAPVGEAPAWRRIDAPHATVGMKPGPLPSGDRRPARDGRGRPARPGPVQAKLSAATRTSTRVPAVRASPATRRRPPAGGGVRATRWSARRARAGRRGGRRRCRAGRGPPRRSAAAVTALPKPSLPRRRAGRTARATPLICGLAVAHTLLHDAVDLRSAAVAKNVSHRARRVIVVVVVRFSAMVARARAWFRLDRPAFG